MKGKETFALPSEPLETLKKKKITVCNSREKNWYHIFEAKKYLARKKAKKFWRNKTGRFNLTTTKSRTNRVCCTRYF